LATLRRAIGSATRGSEGPADADAALQGSTSGPISPPWGRLIRLAERRPNRIPLSRDGAAFGGGWGQRIWTPASEVFSMLDPRPGRGIGKGWNRSGSLAQEMGSCSARPAREDGDGLGLGASATSSNHPRASSRKNIPPRNRAVLPRRTARRRPDSQDQSYLDFADGIKRRCE